MTDRRGRIITDATNAAPKGEQAEHAWQIKVKKVGAVGEILGALWNKEGAWGVWKGMCTPLLWALLNPRLILIYLQAPTRRSSTQSSPTP